MAHHGAVAASVTRRLGGRRRDSAAGRRSHAQLLELANHGCPFLALDGGIDMRFAMQPGSNFFQTLIRWFHCRCSYVGGGACLHAALAPRP